jgi:hypothetical protein
MTRTRARRAFWASVAIVCVAGFAVAAHFLGPMQASASPVVQVDKQSPGGVVLNSSRQNPEAGVWVIAETKSLPVPFRKIVVTDGQ